MPCHHDHAVLFNIISAYVLISLTSKCDLNLLSLVLGLAPDTPFHYGEHECEFIWKSITGFRRTGHVKTIDRYAWPWHLSNQPGSCTQLFVLLWWIFKVIWKSIQMFRTYIPENIFINRLWSQSVSLTFQQWTWLLNTTHYSIMLNMCSMLFKKNHDAWQSYGQDKTWLTYGWTDCLTNGYWSGCCIVISFVLFIIY